MKLKKKSKTKHHLLTYYGLNCFLIMECDNVIAIRIAPALKITYQRNATRNRKPIQSHVEVLHLSLSLYCFFFTPSPLGLFRFVAWITGIYLISSPKNVCTSMYVQLWVFKGKETRASSWVFVYVSPNSEIVFLVDKETPCMANYNLLCLCETRQTL